MFHNRGVFQRFVDELRHTYGTVEALNEAWGLVYWSHKLSHLGGSVDPGRQWQPQYDLAWRRFQARLTTEFIAWQADIVASTPATISSSPPTLPSTGRRSTTPRSPGPWT